MDPVWCDSLGGPPWNLCPSSFAFPCCPSACAGLTWGADWRGVCHVSCSSNRCHGDPRLHCHIHSAHSPPSVYHVTNDKEPGPLVTFCTRVCVFVCLTVCRWHTSAVSVFQFYLCVTIKLMDKRWTSRKNLSLSVSEKQYKNKAKLKTKLNKNETKTKTK